MDDNCEVNNLNDEKSLCLLYSVTNMCDQVRDLRALTCLVLAGHSVDLRGIEKLLSLEELWVVEANLHQEDVDPLKECVGLRRLYLYGNRLESIPDFGNLHKLSCLWLSDNHIKSLSNIEYLVAIKYVNLGNNNITAIDVHENILTTVEILNLSGNPLRNLIELAKLKNFKKLHTLSFSDPLCRTSSITLFANFRQYLIFVLPCLQMLDANGITDIERKNTTEFYKRMVQYYRMKLHNSVASQLDTTQDDLELMAQDHEIIWSTLHLNRHSNDEPIPERRDSGVKGNHVFWDEIATMWRKLNEFNAHKQKQMESITSKIIQLELGYWGNIKFEKLNLSENIVNEQFNRQMDSFVCSHLKTTLTAEGIDLLNVWLITGPIDTIAQKLRMGDSFNNLYIWFPVHGLSETPLDTVVEYIFQNNTNINLLMSKCFVNSDPLASSVSPHVHDQLLSLDPAMCGSRLLVLCGVEDDDAMIYDDNLRSCPTCPMLTCTEQHSMVPLYLVQFKYNFGEHLKGLKRSFENTYLKDATILPKNIEQLRTKNITTLELIDAQVKSLEIRSPMPKITSLDISYNLLESLSSITSAFPKLKYLNVGFNRIQQVDSVQKLVDLNHLVLKWNVLLHFKRAVAVLKDMHTLQRLDLSNNPFRDLISKEHELFFVCLDLCKLDSYNDEPLPRFMTTGKVVVQEGCFPVVNLEPTSNYSTSLMWKSIVLKNNKSNCLGKVGNKIIGSMIRGININTFIFENSCNTLKWLNLPSNLITSLDVLNGLSRLVEVNLSRNVIGNLSLKPDEVHKHLRKLNLSHNYITSLVNFQPQSFPRLKLLDISHNKINYLQGISKMKSLVELYLSHNRLKDIDTLSHCKTWKKLKVLDVSFNPMAYDANIRKACLYHLGCLEYLNGQKVEVEELQNALDLFGGTIDAAYLFKRCSLTNISNITTLSLPNCLIRNVSFPPDTLVNVTCVCLDNNKIDSLAWIKFLPKVERVSLSHNCVCRYSWEVDSEELCCLPNNVLRSLFLDHNCIQNLVPLKLNLFPKIKLLVLNNNSISYLSGLTNNINLEILLLNRNKLTFIHPDQTKNWEKLRELNVERNSLTNLDFLSSLTSIQQLFLAFNKLVARSSLDPLRQLTAVKELTLHGNPVMRNDNIYSELLPLMPSLELLEGHGVNIGVDE